MGVLSVVASEVAISWVKMKKKMKVVKNWIQWQRRLPLGIQGGKEA